MSPGDASEMFDAVANDIGSIQTNICWIKKSMERQSALLDKQTDELNDRIEKVETRVGSLETFKSYTRGAVAVIGLAFGWVVNRIEKLV